MLEGWRRAGAEIVPFSPLAGASPEAGANAVFLPGGYPELHAGRLSANGGFLDGLRRAAAGGAAIYGECGGYMVLGDTLTDADGVRHTMAGLLPLDCAFDAPRLSLGYREVALTGAGPLGPAGQRYRGMNSTMRLQPFGRARTRFSSAAMRPARIWDRLASGVARSWVPSRI